MQEVPRSSIARQVIDKAMRKTFYDLQLSDKASRIRNTHFILIDETIIVIEAAA